MDASLHVLTSVSSRIEAEILVGSLRDSGLRAVILADDEGGMNLALQPGRVRILVSAEDLPEAREILNSFGLKKGSQRLPNRFQKWLWKRLGGKIPKED